MKAKIIVAMVIMLAVLGSLIAGCGQSKSGHLVGVMKVFPHDVADFTYVDIEALAEDPDLEDMYDSLRDSLGEFEENAGIDFSDIYSIAYGYNKAGMLMIFKGEFDLNYVRLALKDQDFEEDEYEGVEIWSEDDSTVAFIKDMLVFGDTDTVKASIRVSQGKETSMYGNDDVKTVVDKLPAGIMTLIQRVEAMPDIDALVGGVSIRKSAGGEGTLEIKGWYKFKDETSAEAALDDLEDELTDYFDTINMDCQLNGEFIEITGETDIPSL